MNGILRVSLAFKAYSDALLVSEWLDSAFFMVRLLSTIVNSLTLEALARNGEGFFCANICGLLEIGYVCGEICYCVFATLCFVW